MKNFLIALSFTLGIIYLSCSENPTSSNNIGISSNIWVTDSLGNSFGGDSTDWCRLQMCNAFLQPAFPNPSWNKVSVPFHVGSNDTLSLFFINDPDTVFIFKNKPFSGGSYVQTFYGDSLNYNNVTKRLYLSSKIFCPAIHPHCNKYGDIQFN